MGAGGIIQNRVRVLLSAVNDPSIYDSLSTEQKNTVESINQKGPVDYIEADVRSLIQIIAEACC